MENEIEKENKWRQQYLTKEEMELLNILKKPNYC
jgi:hypothetical protein